MDVDARVGERDPREECWSSQKLQLARVIALATLEALPRYGYVVVSKGRCLQDPSDAILKMATAGLWSVSSPVYFW